MTVFELWLGSLLVTLYFCHLHPIKREPNLTRRQADEKTVSRFLPFSSMSCLVLIAVRIFH